jgi:dolichol-phosphate mannosyltransferase
MLLSVIIPVFNEEKYIKKILKKIKKIKNIKKEIIVINDGSKDNTSHILQNQCEGLIDVIINNKTNKGKGFACRLGIKKAKGNIILIQDADLEYNPENYYDLIKPILKKETKIVYGSRVLGKRKRTRPSTFDFKIRYLANIFLTYLSNFMNKQNLTDAHTCYKVFSADIIKDMKLEENGFCFCPEITAKVSKKRESILEVPIDYFGRTHDEGKKIQFFDGFRAIKSIIKYNL